MPPKSAERRRSPAPQWSLPPVLAEQILVGGLTALVATAAEPVAWLASGAQPETDVGGVATGVAHLAAMTLPFGIAAGLGVALLLSILRATHWTQPLRRRLVNLSKLFGPAPEVFSTGLGFLGAAGLLLFALERAISHFTTRYYDEELAAWVLAAVTLSMVAGGVVAAMALGAVVRPIARRAGRLASVGVLGLVALASLGVAVAVLLRRFTQVLRAYDPLDLAWGPGAAVAYLLLSLLVRRLYDQRPDRFRMLALAVMIASTLGLVASGATYGRSNRVRAWVEQGTVAGQRLTRLWGGLTDRDHDGHSFAFGGRDCDDGDRSVYPGALDLPGDGVDADCFDGDGSRDVADLGDGHYGRRPRGLSRPNFLIFSVDALRSDHLGCFGYERATSPVIDEVCEQSVRFENVIAPSSRSIRSFPAVWTGRYPSQNAYGDEYLYPSLLEENTTATEVLSEAGWQTSMVMGTDYFDRTGHFFQGFERVVQDPVYKPPRDRAMRDALPELVRLAQGEAPWLLWVHLFNVHLEYLWDGTESRFGDEPVDRYDTEILLADAELRKLLDALEESGDEEDTIVILLSDHGEAFGEHGNQGHSTTLYEEELRSVLMFRIPGVEPREVTQPVGLFDFAPTLLNLAGRPTPHPMPARSLLPLMTGDDPDWPADRLLFSELMPDGMFPFDQKAVRRGDDKLIWWIRDGTFQLFDLSTDPGERHDLSDDRREEAEELLGLLRAWVASTNLPHNRSDDVVAENRLDAPPARMTHPIEIRFPGKFTILGFDLPQTRFAPRDRIPMTFYYRVEDEIDRDLFFYVDMEGPAGYAHVHDFHAHHYPLNGHYRTTEWRAGEILRDPVEMVVPHDIRRPLNMKITLRVLDDRHPVPFVVDGREQTILHLADLEIR